MQPSGPGSNLATQSDAGLSTGIATARLLFRILLDGVNLADSYGPAFTMTGDTRFLTVRRNLRSCVFHSSLAVMAARAGRGYRRYGPDNRRGGIHNAPRGRSRRRYRLAYDVRLGTVVQEVDEIRSRSMAFLAITQITRIPYLREVGVPYNVGRRSRISLVYPVDQDVELHRDHRTSGRRRAVRGVAKHAELSVSS